MNELTGMILAAGFGTRLRPLTEELPKPLVPIGDRSVLAHAAQNLAQAGIERVVLNTHHLADRYDRVALERELGMEVVLNPETEILGTAGGVAGARAHLRGGSVLVHNGDILADFDMAALLAMHRDRDALATLAVIGGGAPGSGPVGLGADGAITRLRDQRFGEETEGAQFIGVHLVSASLVDELPSEGCFVGDVYIPALHADRPILAAKVVERFTDVGTRDAYLAANLAWLDGRGIDTHIGPGAEIDGVTVRRSVIGAGARISGAGLVERCVVWPGAHAVAPLSDAVVLTSGKVVSETQPNSG